MEELDKGMHLNSKCGNFNQWLTYKTVHNGERFKTRVPPITFPFMMAAEVLSRMLYKGEELGHFRGVKIGETGISVSHLQFADDTLLFMKPANNEMESIKRTLWLFSAISGLKVNYGKSSLLTIGAMEEEALDYAGLFECRLERFPMMYLGLPVGAKAKANAIWDPVIMKFKTKLEHWSNKFLSTGGKLTLLNSVLSNLPIYYKSIFKIPAAVKKELERLQRDFFWGDTEEKRKMHTIEWGSITKPKRSGGLGVANLSSMNTALLAKWLFRYGNENQSLWRTIINEKNGWNQDSLMPCMENRRRTSSLWRNTISFLSKDDPTSCRLKEGFGILIGDGTRTSFWKQEWIDGIVLSIQFPRMFQLAEMKESRVAENGSWEGQLWRWQISFRRSLFDWEKNQWTNLMNVLNNNCPQPGKEDMIIWKPVNDG